MPANWTKRFIGAALLIAIAGGLAWFAWPRPVLVDLATVAKGQIEVTADDDGKTRVRHVYTVSAPIAGKVLRISHPFGEQGPSLHVGDEVVANQTVVALMQPALPGFIDVRSRDQLQAEVLAAERPSSSRKPRRSGSKPRWTLPGPNSNGRKRCCGRSPFRHRPTTRRNSRLRPTKTRWPARRLRSTCGARRAPVSRRG